MTQALVLGAVHGPVELWPISSTAHVGLLPAVLGWDYDELDPDLRKSFEVALHAGTALALAIALPRQVGSTPSMHARHWLVLGLSCAPPAVAGYAWESAIERRLNTNQTVAAGLVAGAVAMILADRRPRSRRWFDAGPRDGLWLGVAQAVALVPGVSRAGATLAAARWLRFRPGDARRLSEEVALPVLSGAVLLKAIRLRHRGIEPGVAIGLATGAIASFASTLALARAAGPRDRARPLLPFAVYRLALASWMLGRRWRDSRARLRPPAPPPPATR